jgi:hypothetical protein
MELLAMDLTVGNWTINPSKRLQEIFEPSFEQQGGAG